MQVRGRVVPALTVATVLALGVAAGPVLAEEDPQPVDFAHNATDARRRWPGPCSAARRPRSPARAICTTPTQTTANVNTDCERQPTRTTRRRSRSTRPTRQHHRRRQRLPARRQPGRPCQRDGPVARARHLRRRPDLVGVSDRRPTRRTRRPAIRRWPSTPQATPTTRRWASGSSARRTPRTRTCSWRPRRTAARPGRGRVAQGSGNADERRRPARQGVRDRLGRRQRDRHLRRLPARAEGRPAERAHLQLGHARRRRHVVGAAAHLRHPGPGVRVGPDRGRRRPGLRRLPQHDGSHHGPRRLRGRGGRARARAPRLAGPFKVATTIDGFTDYPIALGRQTYQDSIFRTWAAGNITADPGNSAPPRRGVVGHAQQPAAGARRSVRRQDELGRGGQPVVRRRRTWSAPPRSRWPATSGCPGAPSTPTAAADRDVRPPLRPGEPPV